MNPALVCRRAFGSVATATRNSTGVTLAIPARQCSRRLAAAETIFQKHRQKFMFEAETASLSLAIGAGAQEVTIVAVNDRSACYFRADGAPS